MKSEQLQRPTGYWFTYWFTGLLVSKLSHPSFKWRLSLTWHCASETAAKDSLSPLCCLLCKKKEQHNKRTSQESQPQYLHQAWTFASPLSISSFWEAHNCKQNVRNYLFSVCAHPKRSPSASKSTMVGWRGSWVCDNGKKEPRQQKKKENVKVSFS